MKFELRDEILIRDLNKIGLGCDHMRDDVFHNAISLLTKKKFISKVNYFSCLDFASERGVKFNGIKVPAIEETSWILLPLVLENGRKFEVLAVDLINNIVYDIVHFRTFAQRATGGAVYNPPLPNSYFGPYIRQKPETISLQEIGSEVNVLPERQSLFYFPTKFLRLAGLNRQFKFQPVLYFQDEECGVVCIDVLANLILNPEVTFENMVVRQDYELPILRGYLVSSFLFGNLLTDFKQEDYPSRPVDILKTVKDVKKRKR